MPAAGQKYAFFGGGFNERQHAAHKIRAEQGVVLRGNNFQRATNISLAGGLFQIGAEQAGDEAQGIGVAHGPGSHGPLASLGNAEQAQIAGNAHRKTGKAPRQPAHRA